MSSSRLRDVSAVDLPPGCLGLAHFELEPPAAEEEAAIDQVDTVLGEDMTHTGQTIGTLGYMSPEQVAFAPDGPHAASADRGGGIYLWDSATGKAVRTFEGHSDEVYSLAISATAAWTSSFRWESGTVVWNSAVGAGRFTRRD